MKKFYYLLTIICFFVLLFNPFYRANAQCNNADFETGDFTGWQGTHCLNGDPSNCDKPNPFLISGINQGTTNSSPGSYPYTNQAIMSSGYDAIVGGTTLPVVWPGG